VLLVDAVYLHATVLLTASWSMLQGDAAPSLCCGLRARESLGCSKDLLGG
jgi:hypothetical protein